jgi:hypothetical protein
MSKITIKPAALALSRPAIVEGCLNYIDEIIHRRSISFDPTITIATDNELRCAKCT